ncbi:MAG: hypothetical protein NT135_00420 [Candidatus Berkelbacteria bacterium]|nr:hypothetical protein [Candidatus Berkelbacteria bacterium]
MKLKSTNKTWLVTIVILIIVILAAICPFYMIGKNYFEKTKDNQIPTNKSVTTKNTSPEAKEIDNELKEIDKEANSVNESDFSDKTLSDSELGL